MPRKSIFEFPSEVKDVGDTTKKIYRSKINTIARSTGFKTVKQLLDNPKDVIKAIEVIIPDDETNYKAKRRVFLSSLMYVLYAIPYEQRTEYYEYYKTQKDPWENFDSTGKNQNK